MPRNGDPHAEEEQLETVTGAGRKGAGLRTLVGSRSPDPDRRDPNPVLRVIRGGADDEERTTRMQQAADQYPRKFTEILNTEYGPYEAEVTEFLWDGGDGKGPQPLRYLEAPGWALGIKYEYIGEVNPGLSQSLDVSVNWTGKGSDASVDVMVFGENDADPHGDLREKTSIRFQDPQDVRQFIQLLEDALARAEEMHENSPLAGRSQPPAGSEEGPAQHRAGPFVCPLRHAQRPHSAPSTGRPNPLWTVASGPAQKDLCARGGQAKSPADRSPPGPLSGAVQPEVSTMLKLHSESTSRWYWPGVSDG
jgi:hypothetical protein